MKKITYGKCVYNICFFCLDGQTGGKEENPNKTDNVQKTSHYYADKLKGMQLD